MPVAKFAKSPLTEVVYGVEFNALEFSSVHFGLYWQTIKERFPHPPLDRPPIGAIEIFAILPSLRRVWFESEDKKRLIQLQSNRFHYNWRKQANEDQYPHFDEIYSNFYNEWQELQNWWLDTEQKELSPLSYELTYVNQIDKDFGWNSVEDYQKIFSFIGQNLSQIKLKPQSLNNNIDFSLGEDIGNLSVKLSQGINPKNNSSGVVFELTATTANTASLDITEWFKIAHQSTVETFLDLLTNTIKEEWSLTWLH
jgi:uncharacterized protein (TIGR04255 family)